MSANPPPVQRDGEDVLDFLCRVEDERNEACIARVNRFMVASRAERHAMAAADVPADFDFRIAYQTRADLDAQHAMPDVARRTDSTVPPSEPEAARPGPLGPGDALDAIATALATLECVRGWEPNVRLLGNVRADSMEHMLVTFVAQYEAGLRARAALPDVWCQTLAVRTVKSPLRPAGHMYSCECPGCVEYNDYEEPEAPSRRSLEDALLATHAALDSARQECEASEMGMTAMLDGTFAIGDGTAQREIERLREECERVKADNALARGVELLEYARASTATLRSRLARLLWTVKRERDALAKDRDEALTISVNGVATSMRVKVGSMSELTAMMSGAFLQVTADRDKLRETLKNVCSLATTHRAEDREVILAAYRLAAGNAGEGT